MDQKSFPDTFYKLLLWTCDANMSKLSPRQLIKREISGREAVDLPMSPKYVQPILQMLRCSDEVCQTTPCAGNELLQACNMLSRLAIAGFDCSACDCWWLAMAFLGGCGCLLFGEFPDQHCRIAGGGKREREMQSLERSSIRFSIACTCTRYTLHSVPASSGNCR